MLPILACVPDDEAARRRVSAVVSAAVGNEVACAPFPGSVPGCCARCGGKVWIGPRQQEVVRRMPVEVRCLPCAAPELMADAVTKPLSRERRPGRG